MKNPFLKEGNSRIPQKKTDLFWRKKKVIPWRSGAPAATRTRDPLLRRQMLYPTELRAHLIINDLQCLDRVWARNVAWKLHRAKTSSRTKRSRMIRGASIVSSK